MFSYLKIVFKLSYKFYRVPYIFHGFFCDFVVNKFSSLFFQLSKLLIFNFGLIKSPKLIKYMLMSISKMSQICTSLVKSRFV
jgi:hypothetical protein